MGNSWRRVLFAVLKNLGSAGTLHMRRLRIFWREHYNHKFKKQLEILNKNEEQCDPDKAHSHTNLVS
jgi:hypothetical protein